MTIHDKISNSLPTIISVVIILALPLLLTSCTNDDDSANSQQVVLYCSVDQEAAEPIIAEFERLTGIEVLTRFDTEANKTVGLVQRIRAEAQNPLADVFWSSEIFHTIKLDQEGLLAPYSSEVTADWPQQFTNAQGSWHAFALRMRVIAYHSERVAPADAPRSLEDLLDPQWKDRIVMADPAFGTTGGDVASWFAHYGPAHAREIINQLKQNGVTLVTSNSAAVRALVSGQADICLTDTDDVYSAQRNSHPIRFNPLSQADQGALAIPNTVALISNAPHPDAAAQLLDFLLSPQVESMLAQGDLRTIPIRDTDNPLTQAILPIDYADVTNNLDQAITTAREILQ